MTEGIYSHLFDAMLEMENPTKSKQAYKYKYETLEQVLGIVRPALANHGLMLTQCQKEVEGGWTLETWVFSKGGETLMMDSRPIPTCSDAQAQGSWETYLRRYALRTAFGLTGEDDDGEATKRPKRQEMTSGELMKRVNEKVAELAQLKGKDEAEVIDGLMKTKTMRGAKFSSMSKEQAQTALMLLIKWVDETKGQS